MPPGDAMKTPEGRNRAQEMGKRQSRQKWRNHNRMNNEKHTHATEAVSWGEGEGLRWHLYQGHYVQGIILESTDEYLRALHSRKHLEQGGAGV
jgi:hypothetical protein